MIGLCVFQYQQEEEAGTPQLLSKEALKESVSIENLGGVFPIEGLNRFGSEKREGLAATKVLGTITVEGR